MSPRLRSPACKKVVSSPCVTALAAFHAVQPTILIRTSADCSQCRVLQASSSGPLGRRSMILVGACHDLCRSSRGPNMRLSWLDAVHHWRRTKPHCSPRLNFVPWFFLHVSRCIACDTLGCFVTPSRLILCISGMACGLHSLLVQVFCDEASSYRTPYRPKAVAKPPPTA